MFRPLLITTLVLSLSSCAIRNVAPSGIVSEEVWLSQVSSQKDDYSKITSIKGGRIEKPDHTVFLRSQRRDVPPSIDQIQVYVIAKTSDWKFLDHAYSIEGVPLDVTVVDRDVRYCSRYGCSLAEHVIVNTNKKYLLSHINQGFDFKLMGKNGEQAVHLPANYIVAFLGSLPAH